MLPSRVEARQFSAWRAWKAVFGLHPSVSRSVFLFHCFLIDEKNEKKKIAPWFEKFQTGYTCPVAWKLD